MAHIDPLELKHLKKLCRIDCTPEEEASLLEGLKGILGYVEQLKDVDTTHTPPCSYVLRTMLKNRMRQDEVSDTISREQFLANAPDQIGGMIRVPPVLKQSP